MKFSFLLLAAGLCSFSVASAQTTPGAATSASPSAVPSGMPPQASDPNGPVTPGKVFTTGAPDNDMNSSKRTRMRKKEMRSADKGKMKTKM